MITKTEDGFIQTDTVMGAQVSEHGGRGYHLVSHDYRTRMSVYRLDYPQAASKA